MDKSAIVQIQESSKIEEIIYQVSGLDTSSPLIVLPESMNTQSLEKFMPNASRYRLCFKTTSISDFVEYTEKFDEVGATCFVDAERMSARSIFDLGTLDKPGHQSHKADIALIRTAAFYALLSINGSQLSQKDASDFIQDWSDSVVCIGEDGEVMNLPLAVNAISNVTIETAKEASSSVSAFSESMSAMERVEAKNKDKLPSSIEFLCAPYQGLIERNFTVKVSILTSGEKPKFAFRIVRLDDISETIAEEFKEILVNSFSDLTLDTFIGAINS